MYILETHSHTALLKSKKRTQACLQLSKLNKRTKTNRGTIVPLHIFLLCFLICKSDCISRNEFHVVAFYACLPNRLKIVNTDVRSFLTGRREDNELQCDDYCHRKYLLPPWYRCHLPVKDSGYKGGGGVGEGWGWGCRGDDIWGGGLELSLCRATIPNVPSESPLSSTLSVNWGRSWLFIADNKSRRQDSSWSD